jgi:hypothetical protein
MLKWILVKEGVNADIIHLPEDRKKIVDFYEHGNALLVSITARKSIHKLSDYHLLKKDFAPCSYLHVY